MDPNANLTEQVTIAEEILSGNTAAAERLAELVLALNEWLQSGGFLPAAWRQSCAITGTGRS